MTTNLQLLGRGLDAVLLSRTDQITAHQRLDRYYRAVLVHPCNLRVRRICVGELFQAAWKRGAKPQLALLHTNHPTPPISDGEA
ncbi:hypothetical protein [Stenotrophomonas sp. GZD-301]|uniref:hypothetical protein n=1 Tax=Stenotrophomonas sp. GZD-301 TaxID=3404814 RepID=UPI003BB6AD24